LAAKAWARLPTHARPSSSLGRSMVGQSMANLNHRARRGFLPLNDEVDHLLLVGQALVGVACCSSIASIEDAIQAIPSAQNQTGVFRTPMRPCTERISSGGESYRADALSCRRNLRIVLLDTFFPKRFVRSIARSESFRYGRSRISLRISVRSGC